MVSIVIPDCQDGIYLQRVINSIARQIYKDIEIIAFWKSVDEIVDLPGVKNVILSDEERVSLPRKVCEVSNGENIAFVSYYSVLSPNYISDLVLGNSSTEEIVVANEVNVGDKASIFELMNHRFLLGKLFRRDYFLEASEDNKISYFSEGIFVWNVYKSRFSSVANSQSTYYYTSLDLNMLEVQHSFDREVLENTLELLPLLEENERERIENLLIKYYQVDDIEPYLDLFYEFRNTSYKLFTQYVVRYYAFLFKSGGKNISEDKYEKVKGFLIGLDDESELQKIALNQIGISKESFEAMKSLDFHNFKYTIRDQEKAKKPLYIGDVYKLTGPDLAGFVVSRYKDGFLGFGTIFKCVKAWMKYKLKRN